MEPTLVTPALRLGAALVAGGLVGANRDMYGKPTGVRMHALVALGAALLTMVGLDLGEDIAATSRIIQGIVGGIGFLGAGVIMHANGRRALHLTTAASIWMTAAIGVACGLGRWRLATLSVLATLLILVAFLPIDRALYGKLGVAGEENDRPT